jgi:hypothetical protein
MKEFKNERAYFATNKVLNTIDEKTLEAIMEFEKDLKIGDFVIVNGLVYLVARETVSKWPVYEVV